MLTPIQKLAISILLLIALLVAFLFYPASSRALSTIVLVFGIGTAVAFTIYSNWKKYKDSELTRSEFFRNTALDLLGLVLTMAAAIWLGRLVGGYAAQRMGASTLAIIVSLLAALTAGFIAAWLVQRLWRRLTHKLTA